jgi:hypothetical protein
VMRRRRAATAQTRRPRDVFAGALARSCANTPVPTPSRSPRERAAALPAGYTWTSAPAACRPRPTTTDQPARLEQPAGYDTQVATRAAPARGASGPKVSPGAVAAHRASNIRRRGQLSARSYRLDRPDHPVARGIRLTFAPASGSR